MSLGRQWQKVCEEESDETAEIAKLLFLKPIAIIITSPGQQVGPFSFNVCCIRVYVYLHKNNTVLLP